MRTCLFYILILFVISLFMSCAMPEIEMRNIEKEVEEKKEEAEKETEEEKGKEGDKEETPDEPSVTDEEVEKKPVKGIGVDDELHIRGGRSDEVELLGEEPASSDDPIIPFMAESASSREKKSMSPRRRKVISTVSGLKAGFADDNKQFNYFVNFLNEYKKRANHFPLNIEERIQLKIQDLNNNSLPNANITVFADKTLVAAGKTYADGSFFFFPSLADNKSKEYKVKIKFGNLEKEILIDRKAERLQNLIMDYQRTPYKQIPLDILFILDTTGSMGEEIQRLKSTIEIIQLNLTGMTPKPNVRFGMVLYKDKGDEYRTKIIPFTNNVDDFSAELNKVSAGGGGDGPEDLQAALDDAVNKMLWRENGVRLGFIITDAPPHLDYGQKFKYTDASKAAKAQAIKLFSIGTGGLNITGEYVLRQISQLTYAKYIFLHYGEKGESSGGVPGSVSHHTGANYETDKLEAIIIRFAKEELSYLSDEPIKLPEDYFTADKIDDEEKEETLKKLFEKAISQLLDYSTLHIEKEIPTAIVPITAQPDQLKANSEYFSEQLSFTLSKNKILKQVERKDLQKIMEELGLQLTGLVDEDKAAEAGKLMGAHLLITGTLFEKNNSYEIYLKLLRTETAEVLAVTKLKLDKKLGL